MTAADHWRKQLTAWKIPDELLKAVPDSPYGWPQRLWKRRAQQAFEIDRLSPTLDAVKDLGGSGELILDVGAGTGRASLPLARDGYQVTMVEPNRSMLAGLAELQGEHRIEVIEGRWPDVASQVSVHAVALSAHVVYDVSDIAPFLVAMNQAASGGVVLELTPTHPWVHLGPLYREFHGLARPTGPTVDELVAVVREDLLIEPSVERWTRTTDLVFETIAEAVEFVGRRLVLPRDRWLELERRLAPDLVGRAGHWQVAPLERELCTIWWRSNSPRVEPRP